MREAPGVRVLLITVLTAAFLVASPAPAAAATISVGTETAYRNALTDLSGNPSGPHTITLTADITLTVTGSDPAYLGTQPLTIDGDGHTIDAAGRSRALVVGTSVPAVTIREITIRNGVGGFGGAVGVDGSAAVTVNDATLLDNRANPYDGGAVATSGTVTVANSTFSGNTATRKGGAVFTGTTAVTLTDATFIDNSSGDVGGAVHARTVTATRTTFTGNDA